MYTPAQKNRSKLQVVNTNVSPGTKVSSIRVRAPRQDHPGAAIQRLKARIRELPLETLEELCERNGLEYNKDAPNKGLVAMRIHNSIVNAIIAGKFVEGL